MSNHFAIIDDGNIKKPRGCSFCALRNRIGFVSDNKFCPVGDREKSFDINAVKLVVVQEYPSKDEANQMSVLSGSYGYYRWKAYFEKSGLQPAEVAFTYLLRCYPGVKDGSPMITSTELKDAIKKCRQYDTLIPLFKPNLAVITNGIDEVQKTPALYRLILADISKAVRLSSYGYRPLLLMGNMPRQAYFPGLQGGSKVWGGTYLEL